MAGERSSDGSRRVVAAARAWDPALDDTALSDTLTLLGLPADVAPAAGERFAPRRVVPWSRVVAAGVGFALLLAGVWVLAR